MTLREHLRDALLEIEHGFPGAAAADVESALEILDDAKWDVLSLSGYEGVVRCRSIPDPEPAP